ncbi:MAG: thiamine pyrophosphate-dependent enzyme, partial [Myxococcales bacterium]|nr:thiamine pyrophosphate-dependent enzyme [Myxococcales bacterium]
TALMATGYAWALKRAGEGSMAVAQMGDGTLGEGAVYEALTFASLLSAPVLFLLEWNGYAQSTDVTATTPGDVVERVRGFGLRVQRTADRDPERLCAELGEAVACVRGGEPTMVIIDTRRLMAHSKGDDDRPAAVLEALNAEDPLNRHLEAPDARARYEAIAAELATIGDEVSARPQLAWEDAPALPDGAVPFDGLEAHADVGDGVEARVVSELGAGLRALLESDPRVTVLGEDLADPYGGAFKVTRGLSSDFGPRVFSTPISEAAIVGVAGGAALAGDRPVAEIMFGDFCTLAADQLINHAAKFHYMYGGDDVRCPLTVRLASGARRGYGPTHSQSLESLFCGVPGLRVLALSGRHRPRALLERAARDDAPVLFVENKLLYGEQPATRPPLNLEPHAPGEPEPFGPLCYRPRQGRAADLTVVTYGGSAPIAEQAMHDAFVEEELEPDYFVLTQLWPLTVNAIARSARATGRLIVIEEGNAAYGVGAAVIAAVCQQLGAARLASAALGAAPTPIPCARQLEDAALPSPDAVLDAMRRLVGGSRACRPT